MVHNRICKLVVFMLQSYIILGIQEWINVSFSEINQSWAGQPGLIYYDPFNYSVLDKDGCTKYEEGLSAYIQ